MALGHCILGKFLGVGCHCFPPPLDVPIFSARCLHAQRRERPLAAESGTLRGQEIFRPISSRDLFTCRKSATWDRRLYFPSEDRRAEDFFALKIPTASAGFEPANMGTKDQHATSRLPKPIHLLYSLNIFLTHCGRVTQICVFNTVKLGTSASSP